MELINIAPDRFLVKEIDSVGLVDAKNNIIIPQGRYDYISKFKWNFSEVRSSSKWGLADINGDEVLPCCFNDMDYYSGGHIALVFSDGSTAQGQVHRADEYTEDDFTILSKQHTLILHKDAAIILDINEEEYNEKVYNIMINLIPDYELIKKETTDPESNLYYHKLYSLFNDKPSIMSLEEAHYLYYGYMFTTLYMQGWVCKYEHFIPSFTSSDSQEKRRVSKLYHKYLDEYNDYSFDIGLLEEISSICNYYGRSEESKLFMDRALLLKRVLLHSGNGITEPYYVTRVEDESIIVKSRGLEVRSRQLGHDNDGQPVDVLFFNDNPQHIECFKFYCPIAVASSI